ncbi:protein tweety isoform X3 [Procambarus clarkii]|uniref:protein tweety isoform X3 n=1 Tax=Procambarus clarkii TaxID=6728 RepID=UPI001E6733DE|nr:protein tweety-like isoform X3 [Procambarus clarkii]
MAMEGYSVVSEAVVQRVFWVDWFHHTPHINLTLHPVNDTFSPLSPIYQESLGIIGSVPAGVLILTLLVLLLYLLTRCCDNRPRKPGSITCLKVMLVLFAIFTLGALGVSVWGNEEVHEGVTQSVRSLDNINSMVHSLSNQTKLFDETIRRNLQPQLNLFKETIQSGKIKNATVEMFIIESLHYMQGNISEVLLINVEDINAMLCRLGYTAKLQMSGAEMGGMVRLLGVGELGRWVATLGITGMLMMIVLVVMIGVARHSRCTLITFSVLGLLAMILCWGLTSVYLVASVALSDWCMDPNPFLEDQLSKLVSKDVAAYYLRCDPTRPSPFTRYLTHAQQAANLVLDSLNKVTRIADVYYERKEIHPRLDHLGAFVNQSQRSLGGVAALLECQSLHHHYRTALNATCYQAMSGVVYLLLSAAGSGLLFTILVWITSHTWIYLNHKRGSTRSSSTQPSGKNIQAVRVWLNTPPSHPAAIVAEPGVSEERDPFLPGRGSRGGTLTSLGAPGYSRPRHSHTPPQTPPFPGTFDGMGSMGGGSGSAPTTVSTMGRNDNHHNHHHHTHSHSHSLGPNHGQYATLSKQCKTLESSDFY